MQPLDYWRLCEELTLAQAAVLIVGENPSDGNQYIDEMPTHHQPEGYHAVKCALIAAIRSRQLASVTRDDSDILKTTVAPPELRHWLSQRGVTTGFFFPVSAEGGPQVEKIPDYLKPSHKHYAPKLAAAVAAWEHITRHPELLAKSNPKGALLKWLEVNAAKYKLENGGKLNSQGINEVAKIANWKPGGGANKTQSK